MFQIRKRNLPLMVALGVVLLLICIIIVFIIDTHFSLDPWGDGDVEMLWYFLVGGIFLPGAFRRYRAGRLTERQVPWYHRRDLLLCLIGLDSGLVFTLSVVQKWFEFVLFNDIGPSHIPVIGEGSWKTLDIALVTVNLCWIVLCILFIYQSIKQNKQRKNDSSQTT